MFQLKEKNVVWWPVVISEPVNDGQVVEHGCSMELEILTQAQYDELALKGDIAVIRKALRGWRDVSGVDGQALAFNEDNVEALLALPFVRRCILNAYHSAAVGAPVKN